MKFIQVQENQTRLEEMRSLYEEAFPASEKKPFSIILEKAKQGCVEMLAIIGEEDVFQGLMITMLYQDCVLLDYFAVDQSARGQGIGSDAIRLLRERYADKKLILEIENTRDETASELMIKQRRKHFYEKNGFRAMPYLVDLFDVEMELMTFDCEISFQEYYDVIVKTYGERIGKHIKLICE